MLKIKIGEKFNKLTTIALNVKWETTKRGHNYQLSKFKCECGNICYFRKSTVIRGATKDCGCRTIRRRKNRRMNAVVDYYRYNAAKKRFKWALTTQEARLLLCGNCFYCGIAPKKRIINKNTYSYEIVSNGIDRIDSSIGYILLNCVSCCTFCNFAKNTLSVPDFLENVSRIQEYQYNKVSLSRVA